MLLVTLLFMEVFLQIAVRVSPRLDFVLSLKQQRHLDDEELVWRPHPGHPDHDGKGFRNARVPKQTDVLALGDSQTYGTGVERNQTWVHQLGVLMGVDTYNMAYGGYGPVHCRVLMREALELEPRVIVEAMYTGNDLYDCYALVYVDDRFADYRTQDAEVLAAIGEAESADPGVPEFPRLRAGGQAKREQADVGSLRKALSSHSRLYGLLRACRRAIAQAVSGDVEAELLWTRDWQLMKERALARPDNFYVMEIDRFKTVLMPPYRLMALNVADPQVAEGLRLSLEALRQMRDTAKSNGIRYLVLLIPTKELVFKDLLVANSPVPESLAELIATEESVLEETKRFLEANDIAYVEALPALRASIYEGRQPYQITQDGHPNVIRHRVIAETVQDAFGDG